MKIFKKKKWMPPQPESVIMFTMIELLIVITTIVILASMLLPALRQARAKVYEISCANNLKQTATGFNMYIDDYNGWMPLLQDDNTYASAICWFGKFNEYVKKEKVFTECRERLRSTCAQFVYFYRWYSYAFISYGGASQFFPFYSRNIQHKAIEITSPTRKIMAGDSLDQTQNSNARGYWLGTIKTDGYYPDFRHNGKANFLYIDGHVNSRKETMTGNKLTYWASFSLGPTSDIYLE